MKILTAKEIREADAYTIANKPIASIDLMERAATQCFNWLIERYSGKSFQIFCGVGNNGGDGLVIARLLQQAGYVVKVYEVAFSEKRSEDFQTNLKRLELEVETITSKDDFPKLDADVIVDAIFGSGLTRPVEGFTAELIKHINSSNKKVVAIDIPSGLFSEDNTNNISEHIILADLTLCFQVPKLSLMFPENGMRVGEWHVLPIGLDEEFISKQSSQYYLSTKELNQMIVRERYKFSHKGTYGHTLIISGSKGKMGATILSSRAALRSGTGLVSAHVPKCGYEIIQTAVPEVMVDQNDGEDYLQGAVETGKYNAIGIGPGIDTKEQTANLVKVLIQNAGKPVVFDADAINILGENKTWLQFLTPKSIFTPHPKEFERLIGRSNGDYDRLQMQKEFAKKFNCYVVLKGAHTSIACPDGDVFFNNSGNTGMATAGSGDVLTGIITGLLAQGYSSKQSAILGVYLHGLAGDLAAQEIGEEAEIAGDIVDKIGKAYKELHG